MNASYLSAHSMARPIIPRQSTGDLRPMLEAAGPFVRGLTTRAEELRLQVLVRVVEGRTTRRWSFRAGAEYFYPASTVKLIPAIMALGLIGTMRGAGVTADTPMVFHPLAPGRPFESHDPTNQPSGGDGGGGGGGGRITLRHELRKLFLVSDNAAFNRLYDLVGPDAMNAWARALGLSSVAIRHRLADARYIADQRFQSRVDLLASGGVVRGAERSGGGRGTQAPRAARVPGLLVGRAHVRDGVLHEGPMDFSSKNAASLDDLQRLLMMLTRPDLREAAMPGGEQALGLSEADRRMLLGIMAEFPGDSGNPRYDRREHPDDFGKFLLPGLLRHARARDLTIHNKVGQAYGFTIENAHVRHASGREVYVASCIYTNANGVLNDDRYEYRKVAFPYMAELGSIVASRWLTRDG